MAPNTIYHFIWVDVLTYYIDPALLRLKFSKFSGQARHYITGMNYTALPGLWTYPCKNGYFFITGDSDHCGWVSATTRNAGIYVHPNYRYLEPSGVMNYGSFSFFYDVSLNPWAKYFRVPVPSSDLKCSLMGNYAEKKGIKCVNVFRNFTP